MRCTTVSFIPILLIRTPGMSALAQRLGSTSAYWHCVPSAWNDIGLDLKDFTVGLLNHDDTMERIEVMYVENQAGIPRTPKNLKDLDWARWVRAIWSAPISG